MRGSLRFPPWRHAPLIAALLLLGAPAAALPTTSLWISEVLYNPTGGDNQHEWVELFNAGGTAIDLSGYSLGWGGADYTSGVLQLSGIVAPGQYFVVGGPISDASNGFPVFDQAVDFAPNLTNPFFVSAGVALFDVTAASITPTTVPIDSVVYGGFLGNLFGLMDPTGAAAAPVAGAGAGQSLSFNGTTWSAGAPTPGSGSLPASLPEPGAAALLLLPTLLALARRPAA
jgi:uncharacterized protein